MSKYRITYNHEIKDGVVLEVVGTKEREEDGRMYIRRIDGIIVDMPTTNITEEVEIT
jgi:hypothetical protein